MPAAQKLPRRILQCPVSCLLFGIFAFVSLSATPTLQSQEQEAQTLESTTDFALDSALTSPKGSSTAESSMPKSKHALAIGASIVSGDGVLHKQESSSLDKIRATDGSMVMILGGIYRATPRHILRYDGYLGFARIAFAHGDNQEFFELSGIKAGLGLGYEWVFYRGNAISWNAFLGAEYSATYYKHDRASMLIQEIMPKLGIGFEGRYHHYFELFFGVPVFSHSSLANLMPSSAISKQPRHLRLGFSYIYRF